MKIFTILAVLPLVFAREDTGFGNFQINELGVQSPIGGLRITNDEVTLNIRPSIFNYHPEGAVILFMSGKYLSINVLGRLVLTEEVQPGFFIGNERGPNGKRLLTYNGDSVFQVCADRLIGYKIKCEDSHDILILYSDFAEYR